MWASQRLVSKYLNEPGNSEVPGFFVLSGRGQGTGSREQETSTTRIYPELLYKKGLGAHLQRPQRWFVPFPLLGASYSLLLTPCFLFPVSSKT